MEKPLRIAFVSDIHANARALNAVLSDIYPESGHRESWRADEVWCLGDLLSYGPHPLETIYLACGLEAKVGDRVYGPYPPFHRLLPGNHDTFFSGVWGDLTYYNPHAAFTLLVHYALIRQESGWRNGYNGKFSNPYEWMRESFLFDAQCYPTHVQAFGPLRVVASHGKYDQQLEGTFRNPIVYPWEIDELVKQFKSLASLTTPDQPITCYFSGHTHVPLHCQEDGEHLQFHDLHFNSGQPVPLHPGVHFINPGSVGQPRGARDAYKVGPTYTILHTSPPSIEFRRAAYDLHATIVELDQMGELSSSFDHIRRDWEEHRQEKLDIEHQITVLRRILLLYNSPSNWEKLRSVYQPQKWGWQGLRVKKGSSDTEAGRS